MATRYVKFTQVDAQTGIPVTIEPARNGPTLPVGVTFGFALESQYPTAIPTFYGKTDGPTDTPGILSVITKAEFDAAYLAEIEARKPIVDPYEHFIPVDMLRQRAEKLGIWEDLTAYLAQIPALGFKVTTLGKRGVDPEFPALFDAFDTLSVPQDQRDYLLAHPSEGVPDV